MGNVFFIVSGPSGSGKTSVMRSITKNEVVSFVTRKQREGEVEGTDYYFISKEQFMELKESERLAEYTEYDGNFYGTSKDEIESRLKNGDAFSVVDFKGMNSLKEIYPEAITIFIYSTLEEVKLNMVDRGDTDKGISNRIKKYEDEIATRGHYDYVIKNNRGCFQSTANLIRSIIEIEKGLK